MAIDLMAVNDDVLNKLSDDNYEKTKQIIIEKGVNKELLISGNESLEKDYSIDSFKVIGDEIYLISKWQGELWEETETYYERRITPFELFSISVLNAEVNK